MEPDSLFTNQGFFLQPSDAGRFRRLRETLSRGQGSVFLHGGNTALVEHYAQMLQEVLRQDEGVIVERFTPGSTSNLLKRINPILQDFSIDQARQAPGEMQPSRVWVVHDAAALDEGDLDLAVRLLMDFPGAGVSLLLFGYGLDPLPEFLKRPFRRKLLAWNVKTPNADMLKSLEAQADAYGYSDEVESLIQEAGLSRPSQTLALKAPDSATSSDRLAALLEARSGGELPPHPDAANTDKRYQTRDAHTDGEAKPLQRVASLLEERAAALQGRQGEQPTEPEPDLRVEEFPYEAGIPMPKRQASPLTLGLSLILIVLGGTATFYSLSSSRSLPETTVLAEDIQISDSVIDRNPEHSVEGVENPVEIQAETPLVSETMVVQPNQARVAEPVLEMVVKLDSARPANQFLGTPMAIQSSPTSLVTDSLRVATSGPINPDPMPEPLVTAEPVPASLEVAEPEDVETAGIEQVANERGGAESVGSAPEVSEIVGMEQLNIQPIPPEPVIAEPVDAEPVPAERVPAETVPAEPVLVEPVPAEPSRTAPEVDAPTAPIATAASNETSPPLPVPAAPTQAPQVDPSSPLNLLTNEGQQVLEAARDWNYFVQTAYYRPLNYATEALRTRPLQSDELVVALKNQSQEDYIARLQGPFETLTAARAFVQDAGEDVDYWIRSKSEITASQAPDP